MNKIIKNINKIIFDTFIAPSLKEEYENGIKIGKHSIYLRPTYIDMSSNELRNVAGSTNSDTYIISKSGSTYMAKNSVTGVVTSNNSFSTLFNSICSTIASGGGGSITIKDGLFYVDAKLSLADGVCVYCSKGTEFHLAYNGTMLEINNSSDCLIDGGYMYGNKSSYDGICVLIQGSSFRNKITNNYIYNFGGAGVKISGVSPTYNSISDNVIEDVNDEGIFITLANNNTVNRNKVKTTGYHGIVISGGSWNIIDSNDVYGSGGNYVSGFAHGIAADGNAGNNPCFGNRITNNIVRNSGFAGIEIADAAHSTSVIGNFIHTTGVVGGAVNKYGLYVGGYYAVSNDCIVSNNQVYYGGDRGIYISGDKDNNPTLRTVITGNIVMYSTSIGSGDGIFISVGSHIIIQNNKCQDNDGYGLALHTTGTTDYCTIIGNDFQDNDAGSYTLNGQNGNGIFQNNLT